MAKKKAATKKAAVKRPAPARRPTVGDWLQSSRVSLVFAAMAADNPHATLGELKAELEDGLAIVNDLIGDVGEAAVTTTIYDPH